jgi:hypothetical protein
MWSGGAQSYHKILGSRVAHEIRIYVQRTPRCTYLLSGTRIEYRVYSIGYMLSGEFRVWGLVVGILGLGSGVQGLGFRI